MFLVYKIHPINFLLFWFLSFFTEVIAYEIVPFFGFFRNKKIKRLDWSEYFSADEIICLRSEALKTWEKILPHFPLKPWKVSFDYRTISFFKKAKQELGSSFEHLFLFREIQKKKQEKVYIIQSLPFAYLTRIILPELFSYKTRSLISKINVLCDALWSYFGLLRSLATVFYIAVRAYLGKQQSNKILEPPIKYLWDGVNPNEMNLSPEKRTFPWIIDGNYITNKDVVFLVPKVGDKIMQEIKSSPYQAFRISSLYQVIPRAILLTLIKNLFLFIPNLLLSSLLKFENLTKSHNMYSVMLYWPLIRYLKPSCYIISMSNMGHENPAIEYFNVMGIKTIMYCYSANQYPPTNVPYNCDYRGIYNSDILSSYLIVWHEQFKKFIMEHPQDKLKIKVIGPLMAGNENVLQTVDLLRSIYISVNYKNIKNLRYISVFDVSTVVPKYRIIRGQYPVYATEYYLEEFIKDIYKLIKEINNITIIYKPRRDMLKDIFCYSKNFFDILNNINFDERFILLSEDINPWIPIAMADLCIGMPFVSPIMAAWHYGKPAIYHDPTGTARHHRYQSVLNHITHNYKELESKVEELLFPTESDQKSEDLWMPAKAGFAGENPGTSSSGEFRRYLKSLCIAKEEG